jgi:hypothetical protein
MWPFDTSWTPLIIGGLLVIIFAIIVYLKFYSIDSQSELLDKLNSNYKQLTTGFSQVAQDIVKLQNQARHGVIIESPPQQTHTNTIPTMGSVTIPTLEVKPEPTVEHVNPSADYDNHYNDIIDDMFKDSDVASNNNIVVETVMVQIPYHCDDLDSQMLDLGVGICAPAPQSNGIQIEEIHETDLESESKPKLKLKLKNNLSPN